MRKSFMSTLLTLFIAASLTTPVFASSPEATVSADEAQQMLLNGNKRFVSQKYADREIGQAKRAELAKGQHPFAVIVSCSDSRVPPELLFDQGLGDLFVVRVAGNVLDAVELGSVEYAVEHLGAKLIVVLGHEKCGAVKATVDGGDVPQNIKVITAKILPAVEAAKAAKATDVYEVATDNNVINMVTCLRADSVLAHIKDIKILGAKYHLESGEVELIK